MGKHFDTVEEVLAQLPPDLLHHYTLQHHGGGLQGATRLASRQEV